MNALELAETIEWSWPVSRHIHDKAAVELRRLAAVEAERDALKAENERLTNCLKKANDQAEDFERRWYLADMELERIKALPPVAWCLGNPEFSDSSNLFLAHEFAPDGEHEDEWTALYALGSKHEDH